MENNLLEIMRHRIKNVGFAFKLIFHASKKYFIMYWIFSFIMVFIPFVPLYLWRILLNKLTITSVFSIDSFVTLISLALMFCLCTIIQKLLDMLNNIISYKYNDEIDYYIDNILISTIAKMDLAFFDSSTQADKLAHVVGLMNNLTKHIPQMLFSTIQMLAWNTVSLAIISNVNSIYPLIVVLLSIPTIIGNKIVKKRNYEFRKSCTRAERKISYYQGLFNGAKMPEIKLYGLKDYFSKLYYDSWKPLNQAKIKNSVLNFVINSVLGIVLAVSDILIYLFLIAKLVIHTIAVGDFAYYLSILSEFRWRFVGLFDDLNSLFELSDEFVDIREFFDSEYLYPSSGEKKPSSNPMIEFYNVSFKYPNKEEYILNGCSFIIKHGETVGLVGLNGAGKSTIVKLLCRFYDPTDGKILVDGVDIKEYDIVAIRKLFGVLFQEYVKYALTLRENIALSDVSRMDDDDEIRSAAERSQVLDFSSEFEHGFDENLTRMFDPNGRELSGGQWQRISLARTFFRNAPIVLLDEPSSALDPVAEQQIFEDFAKISANKSAVLISHRLSSIMLCDKILVLKDGRIIEQGTHSELLKFGGEYARLFNLQAEKYAQ